MRTSARAPLFDRAVGRTNDAERVSEARQAASQLVASALILPVLEQLRDTGFVSPDSPFAPTDAEQRFGPLLDLEIADRITSATNFPLIDAIVNQYPGMPGGMKRVGTNRVHMERVNVTA